MKVLYLSRAVLPSEISNSLSIMRVCQAFADSGHDVMLTGLTRAKDVIDPIAYYGLRGGFRVIVYTASVLWDNKLFRLLLFQGFVMALKTRSLIRSFEPDIIYSRLTLAELVLIPRHFPIVYEMHSLGFLRGFVLQRKAFNWLLRRKNIRRIIVTTDMLAEMLRSELPGVDITVARLSAELPVPVAHETQEAFRSSDLQGSKFRYHVGYTGYLDTVGLRGTEIICQAAARMPEAAFHVVGGEPSNVEHWRLYAEAYNAHRNIFFYGYRKSSEMPFFLRCFDVVLAPLQVQVDSRAPTGKGMSPLKLPQYMSYGRAIVASDLPSHREMLTDGYTALLVPPDNVDAWVAAIQSLLDDPERRATLGKNAEMCYWKGYSPEMRVRTILSGISASAT